MQDITPRTSPTPAWASLAVPLIALLAPTLGGATGLWSQAVILCAVGLLFLAAPPRRSLGRIWAVMAVLILAIALTAFLPAHWFPQPGWRQLLESQSNAILPMTRSPQPWLTLQATWLLLAGIAWTYYLLAFPWERPARRRAIRLYAAGIILLAAVAVVSQHAGYKVPFWPPVLNSPEDFGFFPNRNQTANVLALSGILVAALAYQDLRKRRPRFAFWLIGLAVIVAALVSAYSRAGIVLFFGGTALWVFASIRSLRSAKAMALTALVLGALLWTFVRFGGDTFERLRPAGLQIRPDYRVLIQQDAFELAGQTPWLGAGLGNFEPLFRLVRDHSKQESRTIHPESDWLWTAAELGWLVPITLLLALALWLRRFLPLDANSKSTLSVAAALYGLGFAAHGLIDVSGHRLGAVWPALFVLSTAIRWNRETQSDFRVAVVFRGVGLLLLAVGVSWLLSVAGVASLPSSETPRHLRVRAQAAAANGNAARAVEDLNSALRITPLDWTLYYERAGVQAIASATSDALRDFGIARFLQMHLIQPCLDEGQFWLKLGRLDYACEAWNEAVRRSPKSSVTYQSIFASTHSLSEGRAELAAWARQDPDRLLAFLAVASPAEFSSETQRLLLGDPDLGRLAPAQQGTLFHIWARQPDTTRLADTLLAQPSLQKEGWRFLAQHYAGAKNFREAYETIQRFAVPPVLPKVEVRGDRATLEKDFILDPEDLPKGLSLYADQVETGHFADALRTLRRLQKVKGHPRYLWFLEAEFHAGRQHWEDAWGAWSQFATNPGG